MKRIIYIFLGVLLVLQTGGTLFFYEMQQLLVRHKMSELVEDGSDCEEIRLSVDDYKKCRAGDNEIVLDGRRYDVREMGETDGVVTLQAVLDEEEERIIDKITKTAERTKDRVQHKLIELLTMAYILPVEQYIYYYREPKQNEFRAFLAYLPYTFRRVDAPPPKTV